MTGPADFVFWPASARAHGFRGHVEAARAGGFTALAIAPETYLDALESGLTPSDMKTMAADAGAPLRYLDSLTDWAPIRVPAECSPELRARFDVSTDHSFRMCEKLGLTSILAVAGYDKGTVELSRLIDGFGPDGVSARVVDVTQRVVRLQSGYLYHYAFAMLIGVAALVTWMMLGASF